MIEQNHTRVTFFGIKNDAQREGFEVILPKSNVVKTDPVQTLADLHRENTGTQRSRWPCISPYNTVDSSTVSRILEGAFILAGLSTEEFSAKSFRPTGATTAIAQNLNPEIVRKGSRLKITSRFSLNTMYIVKKTLKTLNMSFVQNRFCFVPCYS